MKRIAALLMAGAIGVAAGADIPRPLPYDQRVTSIDYFPDNIIRLNVFNGMFTHLILQDGEEVEVDPKTNEKESIFGDYKAWDIKTYGNHVLFKATAEHADTNWILITNKRWYHFLVHTQWPTDLDDMKGILEVKVNYPAENAAVRNAKKVAKDSADLASALHAVRKKNFDYWYRGADDFKPAEAFDDGKFTYLKFRDEQQIGAIYAVLPDDSETLVNYTVDENGYFVIQRIAKEFVIRQGAIVTEIASSHEVRESTYVQPSKN